jgi:hypothetical protein
MIRVGHLHVVTDGIVDETRARTWGTRLMRAVHERLHARRTAAPDVRVRELTLRVPRTVLDDSSATAAYAESVARQILDRTPE